MTFGVWKWYDGLSGLSQKEMLLFDTPWVLQLIRRPDRTAILLELMLEHNMVQPSMNDEELLEAVEAVQRQQQQPKCDDDATCLSLAMGFLMP